MMDFLGDGRRVRSAAFLALVGAVIGLEGYQVIVLGAQLSVVKDLALMAAVAVWRSRSAAAAG